MLEFMSSIRGVGFVVVAVSVYVLPSGWADTASNPYEPIIARNMFGIKTPPPAPVEQATAPAAPLAKVVLTGITSMFGPTPRALLEITEQEPGKVANVRKPILREGEREGPV